MRAPTTKIGHVMAHIALWRVFFEKIFKNFFIFARICNTFVTPHMLKWVHGSRSVAKCKLNACCNKGNSARNPFQFTNKGVMSS